MISIKKYTIDEFDMIQSVEDGVTKLIYYESRVVNIGLDDNFLDVIDAKYDELSNRARQEDIEKSQKQFSRLEIILGSDTVTKDIIEDYENERAHLLTGKAMILN